MGSPRDKNNSGVSVLSDENGTRVALTGDWTLYGRRPSFEEVVSSHRGLWQGVRLTVDCAEVGKWDSRLLIFLLSARQECGRRKIEFQAIHSPAGLERLLDQAPEDDALPLPAAKPLWGQMVAWAGDWAERAGWGTIQIFRLTGEIAAGMLLAASRPGRFRTGDCLETMKQCGAMALPIVGLISFLVGLIMAFQAVIQLRQFGAELYVANLVGLAVVREMGPMMAAVVLAGRTGAAFAAQIGTMKVNEEIDALQTLGISTVDFLVLPRVVALTLMMPLLAVYANFLGILGGFFVSYMIMDIGASTYVAQTREAIGLADVATGLIKSVAFGMLIAFAGCLRGLQCRRSSAGVGAAATSAVVTGILFIIVADAVFAVIFNQLGI